LVHAQTADPARAYSGGRASNSSNGYPALSLSSVPELTPYPEKPMPQGPPGQQLLPPQSPMAAPMTEAITLPTDPVTGPPGAVSGDLVDYPAEPPAPEAHFPAEKIPPRLGGGVDYLLWWVKDGPVPFPLVTTGNTAAAVPGALGQPGTQVLFGSNDVDFGGLSGVRGTLGLWIGPDARCGVEWS